MSDTTDRLADIKAREEIATPGPWEPHTECGEHFYAYLGGSYLRGVGTLNFGDGEDADADREFTLKARTDVPWLVEQLEQARRIAVELENQVARLTSTDPWQRATDGLNALVDSGVGFWIEPDGHISNPMGDEHIEYDRETERWRLVHDDEEDDQ